MTDTLPIPEGAMQVREIIKRNRDGQMATSHLCREVEKAVARALAAVEAETAERVERETIERCGEHLRAWGEHQALHALGSLPAKYGAKT